MEKTEEKEKKCEEKKVSELQLYDMLVSTELGWQALLYELVKTNQLDPLNLDIAKLADLYLEKVMQIQEQEIGKEVFFFSSRLILAAAILLRMKAEWLRQNLLELERKKEEEKRMKAELAKEEIIILKEQEKEIPFLVPRTPLPRLRKITLDELMQALDKAIKTEERRIKRRIRFKLRQEEVEYIVPRKKINIGEKIREIYEKIKEFFFKKKEEKIPYSLLAPNREEKIMCFLPLLLLSNQKKISLWQEKPFDEIYIMKFKEIGIPIEEEK